MYGQVYRIRMRICYHVGNNAIMIGFDETVEKMLYFSAFIASIPTKHRTLREDLVKFFMLCLILIFILYC